MNLRRVKSLDLTVRTANVLKAMNIKTVYSASKFDWDELTGTRAPGYPSFRISTRVVEEIKMDVLGEAPILKEHY